MILIQKVRVTLDDFTDEDSSKFGNFSARNVSWKKNEIADNYVKRQTRDSFISFNFHIKLLS